MTKGGTQAVSTISHVMYTSNWRLSLGNHLNFNVRLTEILSFFLYLKITEIYFFLRQNAKIASNFVSFFLKKKQHKINKKASYSQLILVMTESAR